MPMAARSGIRLWTEGSMTYKFATETLIERAQQSRKMAAQAPDPRVAAIHQTIADTYDKLAASRAVSMNIASQAAHSITANIASEQRPELVLTHPHGCLADVERALERQVLHLRGS